MTIKGKVLISNQEDKELMSREGVRRNSKVAHVVVHAVIDGVPEICNVRCYDFGFDLPKVGADWTTPRVRKYESDGNVAEVTVCPSF